MNERIKELEKQATETVKCGLNGTSTTESFNRKKFAELIVRECMTVCAEREEDIRTRIKDERQAATAYMCRAYIKEHFGVEE
jgi:DNA-binding ferritin-like protein